MGATNTQKRQPGPLGEETPAEKLRETSPAEIFTAHVEKCKTDHSGDELEAYNATVGLITLGAMLEVQLLKTCAASLRGAYKANGPGHAAVRQAIEDFNERAQSGDQDAQDAQKSKTSQEQSGRKSGDSLLQQESPGQSKLQAKSPLLHKKDANATAGASPDSVLAETAIVDCILLSLSGEREKSSLLRKAFQINKLSDIETLPEVLKCLKYLQQSGDA